MVFLTLAERDVPFVTSTNGCAVYGTLVGALLRGVCELLERDALAMMWAHRLPLRELDDSVLDGEARRLIGARAREGIATRLFDATSELGIPVVYALQLAEGDSRAAQLGAGACWPQVGRAALASVRETAVVRLGLRHADGEVRPGDFHFGPRALSSRDRRGAFAFLLERSGDRRGGTPPPLPGTDESSWLSEILLRLNGRGMHAVAVDLTTHELEAVGLRAVRVIVPELQPLSWDPAAQFRGQPRLYRAPVAMGYSVLAEHEQNRDPHPFA